MRGSVINRDGDARVVGVGMVGKQSERSRETRRWERHNRESEPA